MADQTSLVDSKDDSFVAVGIRVGLTLFPWLAVPGAILLLIFVLLPNLRAARDEGHTHVRCINNLKQIALALHDYHDMYKSFPPAYTVDAQGNPLHSWRTLILPQMEQQSLYNSIDLTKPWDDPVNAQAYAATPHCYLCPSARNAKQTTNYLAVVTPGGCLLPTKGRKIGELKNTDETLLLVEVGSDHKIHWMSPQDADEKFIQKLTGQSFSRHTGGSNAVMASTHVKSMTSKKLLSRLRESAASKKK